MSGRENAALAGAMLLLVERAATRGCVASLATEEGIELLAYPVEGGAEVVIGLGAPAAHAHGVDMLAVLRRRDAAMGRYGAWLPACFEDGSCYLLRRCPAGEDAARGAAIDELSRAKELLHG